MVLLSLTDGFGLIMLVPLLDVLGSSAGTAGIAAPTGTEHLIGEAFSVIGLAPTLENILGAFLALLALRTALKFALQLWQVRLQHSCKDALRLRAMDALLRARWRWLSLGRASDHAHILLSAIGLICGTGLLNLIGLLTSAIMLLTYVTVSVIIAWQVALAAMAIGLVLTLTLRPFVRRTHVQGEALGAASRAMFGFVQEGLAGIRQIKIGQNEGDFMAAFTRHQNAFRENQIAYDRKAAGVWAAVAMIEGLVTVATFYVCIAVWHLSLSTLLPQILLLIRMVQLLQTVQRQWHGLIEVMPALAETRSFLESCYAAQEPGPRQAKDQPLVPQQSVALDGITLRYNGRSDAALDAVSLELPVGSLTAIVGPSGAGKSTLADVLIGLSEPDAGTVRVDGVAITGTMLGRWRKAVACVQQDTFLFNASVRDNLLWSNPGATDDDLAHVLQLAAAGFVFALPEGLNTRIGDDGLQLSGGERQRIALARALLSKPALLILDEATSALDPENETQINAAIANLAGQMTVVVIGHRLGIVGVADQVIRLEKGRRQ